MADSFRDGGATENEEISRFAVKEVDLVGDGVVSAALSSILREISVLRALCFHHGKGCGSKQFACIEGCCGTCGGSSSNSETSWCGSPETASQHHNLVRFFAARVDRERGVAQLALDYYPDGSLRGMIFFTPKVVVVVRVFPL